MEGWDLEIIGKQTILRTLDPGNIGKQTILRTLDPGSVGKQTILRTQIAEIWKYKLKSQHLVINLDQGPHLKCAPGHDSIEDSSIIKSYCLKSGVMQNQNLHISFLYFFHPGGKFWKGKAWVGSSRRGFCSWEIDISGILRHPHFQKMWISWF